MGKTPIQWTATVSSDGTLNEGATWNPIVATDKETGRRGWHCERVSSGCGKGYGEDQQGGCYAEQMNKGFFRLGTRRPYTRQSRDEVEIVLDEKILVHPLHWRKPRRIFVCSMTDLFGEFHTDEMIDRVFAVMALAYWHTFLVLTKRASRMVRYFADEKARISAIYDSMGAGYPCLFDIVQKSPNYEPYWPWKNGRNGYFANPPWPLLNVHLGVSVEDQKSADARIPLLLQTPAALRWISAEPLLGPVDLTRLQPEGCSGWIDAVGRREHRGPSVFEADAGLDWVVVGGESGFHPRPFHLAHARDLIAQCKAAGVACFVKQLGAVPVIGEEEWRAMQPLPFLNARMKDRAPDGFVPLFLRDEKGGDIAEWPEYLRVRQYPRVRTEGRDSAGAQL